MENDGDRQFLRQVDHFLTRASSRSRVTKQLALGCDAPSVYLCEFRRLVRRQKTSHNHPERMIGRSQSERDEEDEEDQSGNLPFLLMDYFMQNDELVASVLRSKSRTGKRQSSLSFFFLDLLHSLAKVSKNEGGTTLKTLKRKREENELSSSSTKILLKLVKAALFDSDDRDQNIISLASSVDVQLLFKAVDILSFLGDVDSVDDFTCCVDLTSLIVSMILPCIGASEKGVQVGTCRLVSRDAMLALVPAHLFSLLNALLNQALKRQNDDSVRKCSALIKQMLGDRQPESLLTLLHALSESDDDLVDALLTLTEIALRLDLTPSPSPMGLNIMDLYALRAIEDPSPSPLQLPATLFLWFTQYSICADDEVLVDLLLNPETKALEYCLRSMKILAGFTSPSRPHLRLCLHRLSQHRNPPGKQPSVEDAVSFLRRLRSALASHATSLRAVATLVVRIDGVLANLD